MCPSCVIPTWNNHVTDIVWCDVNYHYNLFQPVLVPNYMSGTKCYGLIQYDINGIYSSCPVFREVNQLTEFKYW
jgi:hypothetical protein